MLIEPRPEQPTQSTLPEQKQRAQKEAAPDATTRPNPSKSGTGLIPGGVQVCKKILNLITVLKKGKKTFSVDTLSEIFVPAFISGFERTASAVAESEIAPGLHTIQEIFARLVIEADPSSFLEQYNREIASQRKKILEHQEALATERMTKDEISELTSSLYSELSADELSAYGLGASFIAFMEKVSAGKDSFKDEITGLDTLSPQVASATKTFLAMVDYAGTMAGIMAYQLTSRHITIDPGDQEMITGLAQQIVNYLAVVNEIANLQTIRDEVFSYSILTPMILGCAEGIYKEIAKSFPELFPQLQEESIPPIVSGSGYFADFINAFSPFVADLKKAYNAASDTYDPYSEIFYKLDAAERTGLIEQMMHDKKIGAYRKAALELLSASTYRSVPTAAVMTTLKYLSTLKGFAYNLTLEGSKATVGLTVSTAGNIARSMRSLFARAREQEVPQVEQPVETPRNKK